MLTTVLRMAGLVRLFTTLKLRLEQKADAAVDQIKGIAVRIAVAAALAIAAVIFTLLALVAGLMLLYAWLQPLYGAIPSLAILAGTLVAVALLLALAAALIGRGRSARTDKTQELARWVREKEPSAYHTTSGQQALAPLGGVAAPATLTDVFRSGRTQPSATTDILALLQSSDRRTAVAVLGALFAVGWLLGRTLPAAESRFTRR